MSIQAELKKNFPGFSLDVSFDKPDGRMAVLGASGCGKSMTLKCLAGIEKPDSGRIVLNGRILFDTVQRINIKPQKRKVGYLFQNYALFPDMTVEQNIASGIQHKDGEEKKRRVKEEIERFQLAGLEKRYPRQLSGGQQQRVALARIMAYEPELLLLDEPFSAMDSFLKEQLQAQLITVLEQYHGDVILVTHDRDEAYKFCQKLVVMKNGRIEESGETKKLFSSPYRVETARMTGCKNLFPVRRSGAHTVEIPQLGVSFRLKRMIGTEITHIGIPADSFIPCTGERPAENAIPFTCERQTELPGEIQYYLWNGICWHRRKDFSCESADDRPDWLIVPEDRILLLKE